MSILAQEGNDFQKLEFINNSFSLPLEHVIPYLQELKIISDDPVTNVALILMNNSLMLGNDVTELGYNDVGGTSTVCSDSKEPHFRNNLVGDNFEWCSEDAKWWSKIGIIIAIVVSVIGVSATVAIISAICCCCPEVKEKMIALAHKAGGKKK